MIGKRIKEIRLKNNLTQQEFGDKLNHTKSTISKWENDQVIPDINMLKGISTIFSVNIEELISDSKYSKKENNKSRYLFVSDKVSYSGIQPLPVNKSSRVIGNFIVFLLTLATFLMMLSPFWSSTDGLGSKEIAPLLIGTLGFFLMIVIIIVRIFRGIKKTKVNRWNVSSVFNNENIILTSKISGNEKTFNLDMITNVKQIKGNDQQDEHQINIELNNNQTIIYFEIDSLTCDLITKKWMDVMEW